MKIYIVLVGCNYEGSEIMGVHGNLEDAERQRELVQKFGDYVEVQEWELGQMRVDPCDKGGKEV